MVKPLISVIVPVYKVEKYLHTCIDSILSQTYDNWELILVDDGSPDNCPGICDDYAAKDQRIKVIHKQNGGLSSARNAGLDIRKGEYVSFLDSDDFWHTEYLQKMLQLCIYNDADISQCNFVRGTLTSFPHFQNSNNIRVYDNRSIFLKDGANIIMCGKLYKSYLLATLRMPEGKINEDDFTTWKCYFNSRKIVLTEDTLYYYTTNENSIMSNVIKEPRLDFMEAYEERIHFFMNKNEKGMEEYSRAHFCKALLLTSNNKLLTAEQSEIVKTAFKENYQKIKDSSTVPIQFRALFFIFNYFPAPTLKLLNLVVK